MEAKLYKNSSKMTQIGFFFNSWIERLVQKPPEFNQKRAEIGGNFDDGRMKYAQN